MEHEEFDGFGEGTSSQVRLLFDSWDLALQVSVSLRKQRGRC
ncbi:transient receptor potential cation channel, subfamily M, member 4, isoform CRA_b [Rattus norvegicus]|uniref:Transient receptor potential cation channel, subfamily M, member 4, isoform CRA_b n=1 Tax=Rattus norvegicus TaxID=10116 RepID=A6JB06_RAT|nr:transient receptor potential cation channel, subfamily M, member 4, isoform CRA_b [Rattus norvegicus]